MALPRRVALPQLLADHTRSLAGCRRCGNSDPGVLPILSAARAPRVMLVGQAPGRTEVSDRRPFAGRAGRTLFRWLESAGMNESRVREHIYIAAITRCYPGPSPGGRGDRVPSLRERALCSGWLDTELALIRPALIIPVGRLAVDRFLGPVPLEAVVGTRVTIAVARGSAEVIALPHPSGASSWVNLAAHRTLLDRALQLLGESLTRLRVSAVTGSARNHSA